MTTLNVKTITGQLGKLELAEGVTEMDVVRAMRNHKLYITAQPETTLEAPPPAPGGETVVAGGEAKPKGKGRR